CPLIQLKVTRFAGCVHRLVKISRFHKALNPVNKYELAKLRDHRIKASIDTVTKSLVGDYRREHIFTLKQSLTAYRHYQKLIADCDQEVQQRVEAFQSNDDGTTAAADSCSATSPTAHSCALHTHP